jgi:hypothetical protein
LSIQSKFLDEILSDNGVKKLITRTKRRKKEFELIEKLQEE